MLKSMALAFLALFLLTAQANSTISEPVVSDQPFSGLEPDIEAQSNDLSDPFFGPKAKDETTRLNILQALHIAISSINDILGSHDRIVITNICENVLSNLNQKNIDYNYKILDLYNSIILRVGKFKLGQIDRDRFQLAYDQKTLAAFMKISKRQGIPTYGWLTELAPAFSAVLSDYLDYGVNITSYRKALGRPAWELSVEEARQVRENLEGLLSLAWALLERYSEPGDPKLSQRSLTRFGEILSCGDGDLILPQLLALESELGFYPPYWFYRGYYLVAKGRLREAAPNFVRFGQVWRPVLFKDGMRADAAKYCLLDALYRRDKKEEKRQVELIAEHADKDGWLNLLLAGVVYDELGDQEKAVDCFLANLDNGRGLLASALGLDYIRQKGQASEGLREFMELKAHYDHGTRETTIIRENAERGDPIAQYSLGFLCQSGVTMAKDLPQAVKWLRLSAAQGFASAQSLLGSMYYSGEGVPQNRAEAAKLLLQAADQGNVSAQAQLGRMYFSGVGVRQNKAEAVKWLRLAAEAGDPEAQFALGGVYFRGDGAPQNKAEGLRWCHLAAEKGYVDAQYALGSVYDRGDGAPMDKAEAAKWFQVAAEQGHAKALARLAGSTEVSSLLSRREEID
ncbi:MAG: sel1 repeat family protein [Deltaproteobacteria bacterium]|jgi:TPR repeat protein|nr:sel1 repeat family protein [Deltaproteobacteria bacterium]